MTTTTTYRNNCFLSLLGWAAAIQIPLGHSAAQAQTLCYQVVSFTPPNMLRCQQIGMDYPRRLIWLCC